MVSGMMTPGNAASCVHPPEAQAVLDREPGGYVPDVDIVSEYRNTGSEEDTLDFLDSLRSATHQRARVAAALAAVYRTDLNFVVFEAADRIQHLLWPYAVADADAPKCRSAVQGAVFDCYRALDASLGYLLDELAPDVVMLVSDHGFCGQHSNAYVNGWLAEQGLVAYRGSAMAMRRRLRQAVTNHFPELPGRLRRRGQRALGIEQVVDWRRTVACSRFAMDHGIHVTARPRSDGGRPPASELAEIRQEIRDGLRELRDTRTGMPVFASVELREDVYTGPHVSQAPDLVYEMSDGYKGVTTPSLAFSVEDVRSQGLGFHHRDGVILIRGQGPISEGALDQAEIADIAPTVLRLLGESVPIYMDGHDLLDCRPATTGSRA
jgi:predicted AlkP superfamily phosphohydrolase/phosphomutase